MKKLLILVAGFLLLSAASASAFPLWPGYPGAPGTQFEDDNLDFFENVDGSWEDLNGNNQYDVGEDTITVGDVLRSVIEFTNAVHLDSNGLGIGSVVLDKDSDDLVAFSQIEILSIDASGLMRMGEYNNEAMVQFYTGGPTNLDVLSGDPTLAAAKAAIVDGTHLWDFSVTDDPDTFWVFQPILPGTEYPAIVNGLPGDTKVGVLNYALNLVWGNDIFNDLVSPLDLIYADATGDGMVELRGSGDILGGAGLTNAFARSDIDLSLNPIPEPATMSLFGLGLLGMAFVTRRRVK